MDLLFNNEDVIEIPTPISFKDNDIVEPTKVHLVSYTFLMQGFVSDGLYLVVKILYFYGIYSQCQIKVYMRFINSWNDIHQMYPLVSLNVALPPNSTHVILFSLSGTKTCVLLLIHSLSFVSPTYKVTNLFNKYISSDS